MCRQLQAYICSSMVAMLLEVFLAVHSVRSLDRSRVFQLECHGISKMTWVFEFVMLSVKEPCLPALLQLSCTIFVCVGVCSLPKGTRDPCVCGTLCAQLYFASQTAQSDSLQKHLLGRRLLDSIDMTSDASYLRKCVSSRLQSSCAPASCERVQ